MRLQNLHPHILGRMTTTPEQARSTTSAQRRSVVVPEKPALEGLEEKWTAAWKAAADLPLRPHPAPRRTSTRSTPRRPRCRGSPARRTRVLLHAHRPDRALPADARQVGLLPDGLGRQRPAHRASRAELLRRPVRPVASVRPGLHAARRSPTPSARSPSTGPTSSRSASSLVVEDEKRLREAVAHARAVGRLGRALHDDRPEGAAGQPGRRSCATSRAARPTSPTRRRCGT